MMPHCTGAAVTARSPRARDGARRALQQVGVCRRTTCRWPCSP